MQATNGAKTALNMQKTTIKCIRTRVLARTRADSLAAQPQRLFQQHKVLLQAGFSYEQAALILQVSEQQKLDIEPENKLEHVDSSCGQQATKITTPLRASSAAAGSVTTSDTTAANNSFTTDSTLPHAPVTSAQLEALKSRIAFLELELLKQSLSVPPHGPVTLPDPNNTSSDKQSRSIAAAGVSQGLNSTAAALNPAAAGTGGLTTAAAAAAAQAAKDHNQAWWALSQQLQAPTPPDTTPTAGLFTDLPTASMQLAAAAELGHLDPEVYAIAEALAVRRGLQVTPPFGPHVTTPDSLIASVQKQERQPRSVWGRSLHMSRPLAAHAWGDPRYQDGVEGLRMQPGHLSEDVPYTPPGWAVAGTIMVVYLGVLATFLALCVGDAPY